MALASPLVGPPALAATQPSTSPETADLNVNEPDGSTKNLSSIAMVDNIVFQTTTTHVDGEPPMGLTENLSPTFLTSGNPCLDFFFHVVPDTPSDQLIHRLELSWAHDALITLKLICNLRGVRGTGKSQKEGFYRAAYWLHKNHPKTLALNVNAIADFGYLKDFPEILYRILEGPDSRQIQIEERNQRKLLKKRSSQVKNRKIFKAERNNESGISEKKVEGILENVEEMGGPTEKEKARVLRKKREAAKARKALDEYRSDANYRFLFNCIADLFADLLKSDMNHLNSGELFKISLASKWCPSIDSSYDKATLICEGIARRIFPKEGDKEYEGVEEAHYAYKVRDRLRKQVLVPLHKVLELPEVFMSANQWNSLPYDRVASVAMKNYKLLFTKHDKERFEEYMEKVRSGKAKIAAGALLPHEIIAGLDDADGGEVAELQWARMVEDVAKKGKLRHCMAISDVSGSMSGIPMKVSVALGLLVSELSDEPWKGKLITFSENPELHVIQGDSLKSKTMFIRQMDWGCNTDFQKVFDRILEVAVMGKLSEDQMIKRLFVFSDMEFDEAVLGPGDWGTDYKTGMGMVAVKERKKQKWETDYEVIKRKYRESGYSKVPEIVFWNLRNSSATPVVAKEKGVAMVSGFSKNLLTLFLEEGGIANPEHVMELAIVGEEYKKLAVYD